VLESRRLANRASLPWTLPMSRGVPTSSPRL